MGLLQSLIEQSRLPSGFLGKMMLRTMNRAHRGLTMWGLSAIQSGDAYLDVSCGGGNAVALVAGQKAFRQVYGIDLSPAAVSEATAKNRAHINSGIVHILRSSVLSMPFADNYFDAVTTFQSHYHWPDPLAAMQEVYRVLAPGGRFVLVAEIYKIEYHMSQYNNVAKTKLLFEESGFREIDLRSDQKHVRVIGRK